MYCAVKIAVIGSHYFTAKVGGNQPSSFDRGRRGRETKLQLFLQTRCVGLLSCLPVLVMLMTSSTAFAQQSSAVINGTIKDSSGAVVQGATITLISNDTSVSRTSVSNSSGTYVFIDIQPGSYSLKVSMAGFNTITQQQATLSVNQTATFDFTLSVGSTSRPSR